MDWKDNETLYGHDIQNIDNSARGHNLWGHFLFEKAMNENDATARNEFADRAILELNKATNILSIQDAFHDLAGCYILKSNFENAIKYYQIVLQIDKDADTSDSKNLGDAFYNFGLQLNNSKQYDKAIGIFDSAIKYKPKFSPAYNNKGVALLELDKNNEAIIACQKAIAIDSLNHNAYINIGCAYTNLKQYEKALEYLKKAAIINTTDYYPVYIMSVTYHLMGNETKSLFFLEKANKLNGRQQK